MIPQIITIDDSSDCDVEIVSVKDSKNTIPTSKTTTIHAETSCSCPRIPSFLSAVLKPHQIDGVLFMYNAIAKGADAGCILAHAMGLGKTLQVITLIYCLASYMCSTSCNFCLSSHLNRSVLGRPLRFIIICPATLVTNWAIEFSKWIPAEYRAPLFTVLYLQGGDLNERVKRVEGWYNRGGVLILGYEMFRSYATSGKNGNDVKMWEKYLLSPGADIVVCDEAHRLKNRKSELYQCVQKIRTSCRICLTGSPLQNNLEEYWCMVNFTNKDYLNDLQEFKLRFQKPIMDGMSLNSTSLQLTTSRRKLYILQKLLDPFVFRISLPSLSAELDKKGRSSKYEGLLGCEKSEVVIKCELTPFQKTLYAACLKIYGFNKHENEEDRIRIDSLVTSGKGSDLFHRYYELLTVINHPWIARKHFDRRVQAAKDRGEKIVSIEEVEEEESRRFLEAALEPLTLPVCLSNSIDIKEPEPLPLHVHAQAYINDVFAKLDVPLEDPSLSIKAELALCICRKAKALQEKVLLFSRSLVTLDYLEKLLTDNALEISRMDGSVAADQRISMISRFNKSESADVFLISTLTGSSGINCQSASRVILYDAGWNPVHDEQAVARAYRYGQKRQVYVYRLFGCDTIEDTILKQNIQKLALSRLVVDKLSSFRQFDRNELKDYFKNPEVKPSIRTEPNASLVEEPIARELYERFGQNIVSIFDHNEFQDCFDQHFSESEQRDADFFLDDEIRSMAKIRNAKRNPFIVRR